jgi:hypothetical protein
VSLLIAHNDVFPWLRPENFSVPLATTHFSIRAAGARVAERLAPLASASSSRNSLSSAARSDEGCLAPA